MFLGLLAFVEFTPKVLFVNCVFVVGALVPGWCVFFLGGGGL